MKAARSHVENVAHVLTELKHLLPMVLLTLRYKCRAEFEKGEELCQDVPKKKQLVLPILEVRERNMILTIALKFWKHSLINIRIMIIL